MSSWRVDLSWIDDLVIVIKFSMRFRLLVISCPRPTAELLPEASPHRLGIFFKITHDQPAEAVEHLAPER